MAAFAPTARDLERGGHSQFTPHAMLRRCAYNGAGCDAACVRGRRYCAVEPAAGGLTGAQVVEMNLRHLCAHRAANATGEAWRWWDFAGGFASACTPEAGRFNAACAAEQLKAAGIDAGAVDACVGRIRDDAPHDVLEAEMAAQDDAAGTGRGRVLMQPTVAVNGRQYRGRLGGPAVLRALCAGFAEGTEPSVCLAGGLEVDECAAGTSDCWVGPAGESACWDSEFSCVLGRPVEAENFLEPNQPTIHSRITDHCPK